MAPERFRGRGRRADRHLRLGADALRAAHPPAGLRRRDRPELIDQIMHEEPEPPARVDPRIPRDLETIVLKAIAKDPADRYPSAEEMADDLRRFLATSRSGPVGERLEHCWRWARRNPAIAVLGGVLVGVLVLATAFSWLQLAGTVRPPGRGRSSHGRRRPRPAARPTRPTSTCRATDE